MRVTGFGVVTVGVGVLGGERVVVGVGGGGGVFADEAWGDGAEELAHGGEAAADYY